jgi:proteasome assembly chaperone (PAC2) family protein
MADERVTFHDNIQLNAPILIAAFRGWNDAGDAATFAAAHLVRMWGCERLASIDPEDFYDFQAVRPQVELEDGITRRISWPSNEFMAARLDGPHDAMVLIGTEPNTKWKTFSNLIVDVARSQDVELVITLGALLADVPHSRPAQITGTAVDPELVDRLGLHRSRYEGPTGIVGVLHDAFAKAGVGSASLWAAVPHYLAVTPNPKAALALVAKATQLMDVQADVSELELAAASYEERVSEMVATDEDVQAYVALLEERADERADEESINPSEFPSADSLAAEVERFLQQREDGGKS